MRTLVWTLASMVLMVCVAASAWSSEADELRAKAKSVKREAESLAKEGRKEEAEKLFREVKELLNAADKHETKTPKQSDREIDKLHQQLKALAEKEQHAEKSQNKEALAELRKHRADVERALAERREHHEQKAGPKHGVKHPPEAVEETGLRIKHIRVAVENLNAAGLHDIAEELAKKADAMERERPHAHDKVAKESSSPEKRQHFDPEHKHPELDRKRPELDRKHSELDRKFAPGHAPVEELRGELQRLRAELNELREEVQKRP